MTEYIGPVLAIKEEIGTVATILLLLLAGLFLVYRRDFWKKANGMQKAHERRDTREERALTVATEIVGAIRENTEVTRNLTDAINEHRRSSDVVARTVVQALHERRNR